MCGRLRYVLSDITAYVCANAFHALLAAQHAVLGYHRRHGWLAPGRTYMSPVFYSGSGGDFFWLLGFDDSSLQNILRCSTQGISYRQLGIWTCQCPAIDLFRFCGISFFGKSHQHSMVSSCADMTDLPKDDACGAGPYPAQIGGGGSFDLKCRPVKTRQGNCMGACPRKFWNKCSISSLKEWTFAELGGSYNRSDPPPDMSLWWEYSTFMAA